MNLTPDLESHIQAGLQRYPHINKFLGKPLTKRIHDDDPLLCTLVRRLAQGELNKQSLDSLEELICVAGSFLDNPQSIFTNLSRHRLSEFDKKLLDIQAELCALEYFYSKEGFQRGYKLRAGSDSKTPDFLLFKDSDPHALEVKNCRWSYSLYYLFNYLEALSTSDPKTYDRWLFKVQVILPLQIEKNNWPQVEGSLNTLLRKINTWINTQPAQPLQYGDPTIKLEARIEATPSAQFVFESYIFRLLQNKDDLDKYYIRPFIDKLEEKASEAWNQIEAFHIQGHQTAEDHIWISIDPEPGLPSPLTVDFVANSLRSRIARTWDWLPCDTRLWVWFQGSGIYEYRMGKP